MSSIINPPAAVATVAVEQAANVPSKWRELFKEGRANAIDHAVYALARLVHYGQTDEDVDETSQGFTRQALRKLVATFGPITNKKKLLTGHAEFGALERALKDVRRGTPATTKLELTEDEFSLVRELADDCFALYRELGIHEVRKLAPVQPAPRVKTPYVRA